MDNLTKKLHAAIHAMAAPAYCIIQHGGVDYVLYRLRECVEPPAPESDTGYSTHYLAYLKLLATIRQSAPGYMEKVASGCRAFASVSDARRLRFKNLAVRELGYSSSELYVMRQSLYLPYFGEPLELEG